MQVISSHGWNVESKDRKRGKAPRTLSLRDHHFLLWFDLLHFLKTRQHTAGFVLCVGIFVVIQKQSMGTAEREEIINEKEQ
jgi:hypothetical protein